MIKSPNWKKGKKKKEPESKEKGIRKAIAKNRGELMAQWRPTDHTLPGQKSHDRRLL